jgi:hypothetical protein
MKWLVKQPAFRDDIVNIALSHQNVQFYKAEITSVTCSGNTSGDFKGLFDQFGQI